MAGNSLHDQDTETIRGDASILADDMKKLVNAKELSDIKFLLGPQRKTVYAHRCILAARCKVFKAMFSEQLQKGKLDPDVPLVLQDSNPENFITLLQFIYTNAVIVTNQNCFHLLALSTEYGLDDLRDCCVKYLLLHLSADTVCDSLQAAIVYGNENLRTSALEYIDRNTKAVFRMKSFQQMSEPALESVLQSSDLEIDELEIINSIRNWATANAVVQNKSASAVARSVSKHIRLALLSPDEIGEVEKQNEKDKVLPVEMFAAAWKMHALRRADPNGLQGTPRSGTTPRESHDYFKR